MVRATTLQVRSLHFLFSLGALFSALSFIPARAADKLDLGAEYRFRGVQLKNLTYGSEAPLGSGNVLNQDYYGQRARVYLKGKLNPGIEIGAVLQAIGVAGSTSPLLNRYPNENFTPFIENAYIQMNEIFNFPVSATFGRQSYSWASGLILNDDDLGFNGVRLDVGPYWGGIRNHFFSAKVTERLTGNSDSNLHLAGISYTWGIHNIKLGWMMEEDRSGSAYTNLTSTNPATSGKIVRQFYDLHLDGRLEKGAYYSAEYVMQKGAVSLPSQEVTLSGSALTFEGGFDFIHPRYKRMLLAFVFMQGSGDNSSTPNEDEKFNPGFGHRYDGLERVGRGELFAATPYSFSNEERVTVVKRDGNGNVIQSFPYRTLFSGLRTFGFRGSASPWEPFTAGLEYYIYTAMETPKTNNGAPTTIDDNELGRELIFSASYLYAKRLNFTFRWGQFAGKENLNNASSSRFIFEVSGKF